MFSFSFFFSPQGRVSLHSPLPPVLVLNVHFSEGLSLILFSFHAYGMHVCMSACPHVCTHMHRLEAADVRNDVQELTLQTILALNRDLPASASSVRVKSQNDLWFCCVSGFLFLCMCECRAPTHRSLWKPFKAPARRELEFQVVMSHGTWLHENVTQVL